MTQAHCMTGGTDSMEARIDFWLRIVSCKMAENFRAMAREKQVSYTQWWVLCLLGDRSSVVASEIADVLGLSRATVSRVISDLEQRGLVQRAVPDHDRRIQIIEITEPGKALVPTLAELADRNERMFFDALPEKLRHVVKLVMRYAAQADSTRSA